MLDSCARQLAMIYLKKLQDCLRVPPCICELGNVQRACFDRRGAHNWISGGDTDEGVGPHSRKRVAAKHMSTQVAVAQQIELLNSPL